MDVEGERGYMIKGLRRTKSQSDQLGGLPNIQHLAQHFHLTAFDKRRKKRTITSRREERPYV